VTERALSQETVAPDFAAALRGAVRASGLGLESIQRRLADRDVEVSVATLSYWQNGTRYPGRKRSHEVVAHLESVLELPPRSLRVHIPPPRPRGRATSVYTDIDGPQSRARREAVRRIFEQVRRSPGRRLTRISQHDVLTISADRRVTSLHSRRVARADLPGIDSLALAHVFDDADAGTPQLVVHSGGEIAHSYRDSDSQVNAVDLSFGRELQRGETVVIDYEVTSDRAGCADRSYDSSCGMPVREQVLQVRFRSDDPPAWCESYRLDPDGQALRARQRVAVDPQGHAHVTLLDCPPGTFGLAWDWS